MDIKQPKKWKEAFGDLKQDQFIFNGEAVDPGIMGNYTYAYLGNAISKMDIKGGEGLAKWIYSIPGLMAGGGFAETKAAGPGWLRFPFLPYFGEDPSDVISILKGHQWYSNEDCKKGRSTTHSSSGGGTYGGGGRKF